MSNHTASSTIRPVTNGCQLALRLSKFIPFKISVRIKPPMNVPNSEPTPPNNDVPPITTAAMVGSVSVSPMSPSAEFRRAR